MSGRLRLSLMPGTDHRVRGDSGAQGQPGAYKVIWLCTQWDVPIHSDSNDPVVCSWCKVASAWVEATKVWRIDGGAPWPI